MIVLRAWRRSRTALARGDRPGAVRACSPRLRRDRADERPTPSCRRDSPSISSPGWPAIRSTRKHREPRWRRVPWDWPAAPDRRAAVAGLPMRRPLQAPAASAMKIAARVCSADSRDNAGNIASTRRTAAWGCAGCFESRASPVTWKSGSVRRVPVIPRTRSAHARPLLRAPRVRPAGLPTWARATVSQRAAASSRIRARRTPALLGYFAATVPAIAIAWRLRIARPAGSVSRSPGRGSPVRCAWGSAPASAIPSMRKLPRRPSPAARRASPAMRRTRAAATVGGRALEPCTAPAQRTWTAPPATSATPTPTRVCSTVLAMKIARPAPAIRSARRYSPVPDRSVRAPRSVTPSLRRPPVLRWPPAPVDFAAKRVARTD